MTTHYYASYVGGWRTAATKEAVLLALAKLIGGDEIKRHTKAFGGVSAVVCCVELPGDAAYTISNHMPNVITNRGNGSPDESNGERVPLSEIQNIRIKSGKGAFVLK